jgi:hypothetical protein
MHAKGQVWFAPLEEIASHVRTVVREKRWTARVDQLPYYSSPIPELGAIEPSLAS